MVDPTEEFFAGLCDRAREVLPAKASGTVRIDLIRDSDRVDHWYVTFERGEVQVSREDRGADVVLTTDKPLFDCLTTGEQQVITNVYQGRLDLKGTKLQALGYFRRLLPDAKGARDPREMAPTGTRRRQ
jgi:hypothetical protein